MIFNGDKKNSVPKKGKVYIVHGWTYTIEPWKPVAEQIEKAGFRVEMVKVPGLTSPSGKVWTVEDYVKFLDKEIPDNAIALGHSNGGRLLLNLLVKKPEKLKHLILLDSAGIYEPNKKRTLTQKIAKIGAPLKKVKILRKAYHKLIGANDYDKAPENMKKTLTNMLESDKDLDVSGITTPTTIIWGGKDTITPLSNGEKFKDTLQKSELIVRQNWPHSPYLTDPDGLSKLLIKVLENIAK